MIYHDFCQFCSHAKHVIISIVKNKSGKFNLEKPTVYSTSAGDKMMTVEISLIFSSDSWPMWFTDKSYRHLRGRSKSMLKRVLLFPITQLVCKIKKNCYLAPIPLLFMDSGLSLWQQCGENYTTMSPEVFMW